MKETFIGYYRPAGDSFLQLWNSATFILDANAILDLYRCSLGTRESLIGILRSLAQADRLWMPHRAASEYHENRPVVIASQAKEYDDVSKRIAELGRALTSSRHPFTDEGLLERFRQVAEEMQSDLSQRREAQYSLLSDDPILGTVTEVYAGRVGSGYAEKRLAEIESEGSVRYAHRIPPGYGDIRKDGLEKYGDLLIWFQMMDRAKEAKAPLIFVTGDEKEDWWLLYSGRTLGPRPELIAEMRDETSVDFYMYKPDQFMMYAKDHLGIDVPESAVSEMRVVTRTSASARAAREAAIAFRGARCQVCGLDFVERYGDQARKLIEVHGLKRMLADDGNSIDPEKDLMVLCSNCHKELHAGFRQADDMPPSA